MTGMHLINILVFAPYLSAEAKYIIMTDLIDLLPPSERLYEVFKEFIGRLEEEHARKEKRLDRCFEEHRRRIHRAHLKIQSSYKSIFEELMEQVKEDRDIPLVEFMERAMRAKDRGIYEKVVRTVLPSIDSVEKEGGHLEIACKRHEAARIGGSCLYPGDKYFSFFDEFMDGFDDSVYFRVATEDKDAYKAREKKEEELLRVFLDSKYDTKAFAAGVRVDIEDLLSRGAGSVPDILQPKNEPSDTGE